MAVKIRLSRHGAKKRPYYRVVVADERMPRDGRYIEQVGTYNPLTHPHTIELDLETIDAWVGKGAQLSDTVSHLVDIVRGGNQPAPEKKPKKSKKQIEKEKAAQLEAEEAAAAKEAEAEAADEASAEEHPADDAAPVEKEPTDESSSNDEKPAEEAPKEEEKPAEEKSAEDASKDEEPAE